MQELTKLLSRARREGIVRGDPITISPVTSGTLNGMVVIQYADGSQYYWKRFLSRVDLPWLDDPGIRMRVETRALRLFRVLLDGDLRLPVALIEDKANRSLLLSDAGPPRSRNWQDAFLNGSPEITLALAKRIGAVFAKLATSSPHRPFRETFEQDAAHWERWLHLRTMATLQNNPPVCEGSKRALSALHEEARASTQRCLLHIDFIPKNIIASHGAAGLIDFELATTVGDAASDFGFFLGHLGLLLLNKARPVRPAWMGILARIATSYVSLSNPDHDYQQRVMRYAGAAMLYRIAGALRGAYLNPTAVPRQLDLAQQLLTTPALIDDFPHLLGTRTGER